MSKTKSNEKELEDIWLEDSERKIRDMDEGKDMSVPEKEGFTDFDQEDDEKPPEDKP